MNMTFKHLFAWFGVIGLVLSGLADGRQEVGIKGVSLLWGGQSTAARGINNIIDRSGLQTDPETGVVYHEMGEPEVKGMYVSQYSPSAGSPTVILLELNDGAAFDRIRIFNGAWFRDGSVKNTSKTPALMNRCVRAFELYYGDAAVANYAQATNLYTKLDVGATELNALAYADAEANPELNVGETFDLVQTISAKYVLLAVTSAWDGTPSATCLSEVQFFVMPNENDPPSFVAGVAVQDAASGAISASATLSGGAAATVTLAASSDGGETFVRTKTMESDVAVGENVTLSFTQAEQAAWEQFKTYDFYLIADNALGSATNKVASYFIGPVNTWFGAGAGEANASAAENWSKGVPAGDFSALPLMLSDRFSKVAVRWVAGENGLVSDIPVVMCDNFTGRFRVDTFVSGSPVTLAQGDVPFAVGDFDIGLSKTTPLTLKAGSYTTGPVQISMGYGEYNSSLAVASGATLTSGKMTVGVNGAAKLRLEPGAEVNVNGDFVCTQGAVEISVPKDVKRGVYELLTVTGAVSGFDSATQLSVVGAGAKYVTANTWNAASKTLTLTVEKKDPLIIIFR